MFILLVWFNFLLNIFSFDINVYSSLKCNYTTKYKSDNVQDAHIPEVQLEWYKRDRWKYEHGLFYV